jgi:GT2 family glycosyltransferase
MASDVTTAGRQGEGATGAMSLRVQVVLYRHEPDLAMRLASALGASARKAKADGVLSRVELRFGDSSPEPFPQEAIGAIGAHATRAGIDDASYEHFGENLGSAGGSNRLAAGAQTDFLLVLNPDTYASPGLLGALIDAGREPGVGAVDARQIPLEHPKHYDLATGDTSWGSGACLLVRTSAFHQVGGFDAEFFFLHCDDVDISWRLRLAGWRVRHAPFAVVFHDKRIAAHGSIEPTETEVYHSLRGRLLLARRYCAPEVEAQTIAFVERHGSEPQRRALADYTRQAAEGRLPDPIGGTERIAQFIDGEYAEHRF